ncbi:MAG: sigma-54-dependent Fis family transcriptional regulator [Sedimentibacter sp.]|jgi:transcriptional regulator with PAS, ATPase and Fis domain|nr:sigma-54-dependent Fis family transcriptional regulator [Sedimentibacter sp.]
MFSDDSYAKQFADMMSDGFIFIDDDGIIQIYNSKAKEIFGIDYKYDYVHGSGKIENGDIVIIADTSIGVDDGGLKPEVLKYIGIADMNIENGDSIIAIGSYNDVNAENFKYIYNKQDNPLEKIELSYSYAELNISAYINYIDRNISIEVNGIKYSIDYVKCFGHMVVLDSKTKNMKFYQTKGYTAKGEGIFDLLSGMPFRSKGDSSDNFDVIGRSIFEIHKDSKTTKEFFDVATGIDISYSSEYKEINGRPTICSLFPVNKGDKRVGAVLKINDISEVKNIIKERDEALKNLYQIERKLGDEETTNRLFPDFIGDSREIINVKKHALKAAKSNSTVLLLGESGTGKSILAKAIHDNSKYKDNPFIAVNCAALPETLLESELFGYEGGAFTGAKIGGKVGIFELAQGGTLFLDEIGEITPSFQAKLLQVLQDKTFYKVGGKLNIKLVARIIVATNKNLEEEVQKGNFREDLYYRINVLPILIPPLRDRKHDIYSLATSILPKICKRTGCENKGISGEALTILSDYDYPGNVRELENILERAVNITEGNTIFSKHLAINTKNMKKSDAVHIKPLRDILLEAEKLAIREALEYHKGNKREAMNSLEIGKTSFYEKIKNLD